MTAGIEQSQPERQWVLVGLGNPGKKYAYTRHNIGAMVIEKLAHAMGWELKEDKRLHGLTVRGRYEGIVLHLLLPMTYMNESGRSVRAYIDYFKLSPASLLVVSDDVELPFDTLRFRARGSSGGHNGLKSIEQHLGTQEYMRLKMGVGKDVQNGTLADYVLDGFKPEELALLPSFLERGVGVIKKQIS